MRHTRGKLGDWMGGKPRFKQVQCVDCGAQIQQYQYGDPRLRKIRCAACTHAHGVKYHREWYAKRPKKPRKYPCAGECMDCGCAIEKRTEWHKRCASCAKRAIIEQDRKRGQENLRRLREIVPPMYPRNGECQGCGASVYLMSYRSHIWCSECKPKQWRSKISSFVGAERERFTEKNRSPGRVGNLIWREAHCVDCNCAIVTTRKMSPRCRSCALVRYKAARSAAGQRRKPRQFPRPATCVDCGAAYSQVCAAFGGEPNIRCADCAKVRHRVRDAARRRAKSPPRAVVGCVDCKADFVQHRGYHLRCRACADARASKRRAERSAAVRNDPAFVDAKRKYQREYARNKRRNDPAYKLRSIMSGSVKRHGTKKPASWLKLMPYTLEELMAHLERQFSSRMKWSNHGTLWEIDHIIPISSFNITGVDCPDFKACWALSNLRPLLKEKNRRKSAKRENLL